MGNTQRRRCVIDLTIPIGPSFLFPATFDQTEPFCRVKACGSYGICSFAPLFRADEEAMTALPLMARQVSKKQRNN